MKKIAHLIILIAALSSMGTGLKEQIENFQPAISEERILNAVVPGVEYGKPIYLYSADGLPYRCYLRSDGLPLSCRRTEQGDETKEALAYFAQTNLKKASPAAR